MSRVQRSAKTASSVDPQVDCGTGSTGTDSLRPFVQPSWRSPLGRSGAQFVFRYQRRTLEKVGSLFSRTGSGSVRENNFRQFLTFFLTKELIPGDGVCDAGQPHNDSENVRSPRSDVDTLAGACRDVAERFGAACTEWMMFANVSKRRAPSERRSQTF